MSITLRGLIGAKSVFVIVDGGRLDTKAERKATQLTNFEGRKYMSTTGLGYKRRLRRINDLLLSIVVSG